MARFEGSTERDCGFRRKFWRRESNSPSVFLAIRDDFEGERYFSARAERRMRKGLKAALSPLAVLLVFVCGNQRHHGAYAAMGPTRSRRPQPDSTEHPPVSRRRDLKQRTSGPTAMTMKLSMMSSSMKASPERSDRHNLKVQEPSHPLANAPTSSRHVEKEPIKTASSNAKYVSEDDHGSSVRRGSVESVKGRKGARRRSGMQSTKVMGRGMHRIKHRRYATPPFDYDSLPIPARPSEPADFYPTQTPTTFCSACTREAEFCHQCLSKLVVATSDGTLAPGACSQLLQASH
jgi:hypothetical protein